MMKLSDAQKELEAFLREIPQGASLSVVDSKGAAIYVSAHALSVVLEASRPVLYIPARQRCGKPVRSGRAFCELDLNHEGLCE